MLTLRKCTVICSFFLVVLLGASCAPAATPTPTPTPLPPPTPTTGLAATPTSEVVATATPIPTEAPTVTPAPEVVGTPTSPEEVPRISLEELKELMDSGAGIAILDCQPRNVYGQGHIKGAISLPWAPELDEEEFYDSLALPWDVPIITYCDCGPGEADSADVALQLIKMGFQDVKVLADPSIRGWMEAGYPME